jgi:hypothetical protein
LRQETAEAKAERIMAEELLRRGWTEADLAARRKSEPDKLAISARLRSQAAAVLSDSDRLETSAK